MPRISTYSQLADVGRGDETILVDTSAANSRKSRVDDLVSGGRKRQALAGFASGSHAAAAAGTLRGALAGFMIAVMFRINRVPTSDQHLFANARVFNSLGGYFAAVSGDRFRFGIGQASDGSLISNFVNADLPSYQLVGRTFMTALRYNGTAATGFVNGEGLVSLTPSSGYQLADAALVPYLGRNDNAGSPQPGSSLHIYGAGYVEGVITDDAVVEHYIACMESGSFLDLETGAFDSYWSVDDEDAVPGTLTDLGGGGVDMTTSGSLTLVERAPIF